MPRTTQGTLIRLMRSSQDWTRHKSEHLSRDEQKALCAQIRRLEAQAEQVSCEHTAQQLCDAVDLIHSRLIMSVVNLAASRCGYEGHDRDEWMSRWWLWMWQYRRSFDAEKSSMTTWCLFAVAKASDQVRRQNGSHGMYSADNHVAERLSDCSVVSFDSELSDDADVELHELVGVEDTGIRVFELADMISSWNVGHLSDRAVRRKARLSPKFAERVYADCIA